MDEPDYREVEGEEERRLLHSFGYWDLVALGAVAGAGLGFLYGLGAGSRQRAVDVLVGMAIGMLVALTGGWAKIRARARERFFAGWAAQRCWAYRASGEPFEDTPFLSSGDRRRASDFFWGFWTKPGVVLYQHKRITGSGRSEQVYTYLVLHFLLARPVIDRLQIWPRSHSSDLGPKLSGHLSGSGEEVDLESTELMQYYRVSGLPGKGDEVTRLLAPSAIVKLLDFHRGLSDTKAYFEIQGAAAAFLVEKALSPKQPQVIEELLELWKPIADWLFEESGEAGAIRPPSGSPEGTEPLS